MPESELAAIASRQYGLVTKEQALEIVSGRRLEYLVETRWLESVRKRRLPGRGRA